MIFFTALITIGIVQGQDITIGYVGNNITLLGPSTGTIPTWYKIYERGWWIRPCDQGGSKYICTRDLTITNLNTNDNGYYFCNNYGGGKKSYTVEVRDPTTLAQQITTFSSSMTRTTSHEAAYARAMLQKINTTNSTILNNPNEIPKSTIGIIVAVAIGMIIIIICMIVYACCYRKFQHEEKGDHLLSFDI
ncbi:20.5 kDa glycoprotein [Human mastadenovirus B]|uniref:20.5 kDa glycoprotein n=1 Tax=Human mastadenovirus B TaxID=108098 RepID=A0A0K0PY81_9ADEN|nr:20.5 kDa glycoprotein [Human mastadenovirus B]